MFGDFIASLAFGHGDVMVHLLGGNKSRYSWFMKRHTSDQDDTVFDAILVILAILAILAVALTRGLEGDAASSGRDAQGVNAISLAD
jgi:hypothetical protein